MPTIAEEEEEIIDTTSKNLKPEEQEQDIIDSASLKLQHEE